MLNSPNSSAYTGPEISCAGERSRRFAISSIESERRHLSPFRYPCRVERGIPSSFENSSFVFPVSFILLCSMAAIFFSICISKATSHQKDTKMVSFGKYRHAGKAPSFPARRKAVQIRRDLRPSEAAARWQDCLDPAGFSNGFVKFIEKCVAGRKGLKSRVNSCILKIKITAGPDRWSAGVMDGSKREGVIKKSRKVNTEERDLVGRTAAHGAHQQTIR